MQEQRAQSFVLALLLVACSDDSNTEPGSLSVRLDAEATIVEGLEPGDDNQDVRDGWSIEFDKYLVTVGNVHLQLSTNSKVEAEDPAFHVVDLAKVPSSGLELWSFEELRPGRWEFGYETGVEGDPRRHDSVERDDFDTLVESGWTYFVEGTLSNPDGRSCPPTELANLPDDTENVGENQRGDLCYANTEVHFVFGAAAGTAFGPCEIDGVPGVTVPVGGSQTASITIHGDHLFFNGFPEGSEGSIRRLAQWWADADLDLNGTVTADELKKIPPSALLGEEYSLGGSPLQPLDSMYQYVIAQLTTQGHFQGEGECLASQTDE